MHILETIMRNLDGLMIFGTCTFLTMKYLIYAVISIPIYIILLNQHKPKERGSLWGGWQINISGQKMWKVVHYLCKLLVVLKMVWLLKRFVFLLWLADKMFWIYGTEFCVLLPNLFLSLSSQERSLILSDLLYILHVYNILLCIV